MYSIPQHRQRMYDYYSLDFDKEGCPMKRVGKNLVFHPILPPYLIVDFVLEYQKTKQKYFLDCADKICTLALKKTETFNQALVFWYYPEDKLSLIPKKFYSALTQSWYIKAMCLLSKYIAGKYDNAIKRIFNSLLIPVNKGGVLLEDKDGWIVEEYPFDPPLYTLNGWLTVLRCITHSVSKLDQIKVEYKKFLDNNFAKLCQSLSLYDVPHYLNSRYQLTGFTRLKILFDYGVNFKIAQSAIHLPKIGNYDFTDVPENGRWGNYIERLENRFIQFNILQSLASYPEENSFSTNISVNKDSKACFLIGKGEYRADISGVPTTGWKNIGEVELKCGENYITQHIPYDEHNLFAYPTNFKKNIGGKLYNGYHFVHIVDLGDLYRYSKIQKFKEYGLKWLCYYQNWHTSSFLNKVERHHCVYGENFSSHVVNSYFGD